MRTSLPFLTVAAGALLSLPLAAQEAASSSSLSRMTLEQLVNVKVTSVSKKSEKASEAPAAIYVITAEDIRRSGATSIPEALRLAPGIQVARAGSGQWAISARGFNDQFANKLLVLMDGRTLYTPIFSGVYWDVQHQLLDNIERIEVIRGPGATLWGANAVNGVINIITKQANDTQGTYTSLLVGDDERAGEFRYGGKAGENGYYRAYVSHHDRDEQSLFPGDSGAGDDWKLSQGGFRVDWSSGKESNFTVQGDYYEGDEHFERVLPDLTAPFILLLEEAVSLKGGNLMAKWERHYEEGDQVSLQGYYDHTKRERGILGDHQVQTADVEFQHITPINKRNELTWGLGYRLIHDSLGGSFYLNFSPDSRTTDLLSGFVQNKYAIVENTLFLTLGSKFEHNDFTGLEYQPNARIAWLVDDNKTLWGSVSRAVRTPNRGMDDISLTASPVPGAGFARLIGDEGAESETLVAYEIGYRARPRDDFAFDVTAFYNDYDELISNNAGAPFLDSSTALPPHFVFPLLPDNDGQGEAYGVEAAANWALTDDWKLAASYSFLKVNISGASTLVTAEGSAPEHQLNLRSYLNLTPELELDNLLYFNDNLSGENIDSYFRFDTRLGWRPADGLELSLVGQNLLDDRHPEFSSFLANNAVQIGRSFYGRIALKF